MPILWCEYFFFHFFINNWLYYWWLWSIFVFREVNNKTKLLLTQSIILDDVGCRYMIYKSINCFTEIRYRYCWSNFIYGRRKCWVNRTYTYLRFHFHLPSIGYINKGDVHFFSGAKILFKEIRNKSFSSKLYHYSINCRMYVYCVI